MKIPTNGTILDIGQALATIAGVCLKPVHLTTIAEVYLKPYHQRVGANQDYYTFVHEFRQDQEGEDWHYLYLRIDNLLEKVKSSLQSSGFYETKPEFPNKINWVTMGHWEISYEKPPFRVTCQKIQKINLSGDPVKNKPCMIIFHVTKEVRRRPLRRWWVSPLWPGGKMTEENRTPAAWARNCLNALQELNPSYRKNREVTGRLIEFVREDDSGLTVSHNFIKIRDSYNYSFALLFTTRRTPLLVHCMVAGSRFDHNRTIWRQFLDDLGLSQKDPGYPKGVWSFGPWRSNTMENLRQGLKVPEEHLLPFYRQQLRKGKAALVALFEEAMHMVDRLPTGVSQADAMMLLDPGGRRAEMYKRECYCLDALKIARGGRCNYECGPPEPGFLVEDVPRDVIVLDQLSVFLQERDLLPDVVDIARKL